MACYEHYEGLPGPGEDPKRAQSRPTGCEGVGGGVRKDLRDEVILGGVS